MSIRRSYMNNYTLFSNPIADSIFKVLGYINIGLITTAMLLVTMWYVPHAIKSFKYFEYTIPQQYEIYSNNSRYIIQSNCYTVMVDAKTHNIVNKKDGYNDISCAAPSKAQISSIVSKHETDTQWWNRGSNKIIYYGLFMIIIMYGVMTTGGVIFLRPVVGATGLTVLWLAFAVLSFPLNFGSQRYNSSFMSDSGEVYVTSVLSSNDNRLYISTPLTVFGKIAYSDTAKTPENF